MQSYLRLRSLIQLETALREVDTNSLHTLINDSDGFDPYEERLVVAELSRRRFSDPFRHKAPSAPPNARSSFLPPFPSP
jgi:hypothetical protein